MEREEDGGGVCGVKKPKLDFDKCFEDSYDEPPPELVVVKTAGDDGQRERSQDAVLMQEIKGLPDDALDVKIGSLKRARSLSHKLPDKGEKLKALLSLHEGEKARRKLATGLKGQAMARLSFAIGGHFKKERKLNEEGWVVGGGFLILLATGGLLLPSILMRRKLPVLWASLQCKNTEQAENSRPSGDSAEGRGEARSGSRFGSLFSRKLEADKDSSTRIYDAFDDDPRALGHGDRKKRKQRARNTHKGKEKNGLSWKGRESRNLATRNIISSQKNDVHEDMEKHRLKNACQGFQSDKSSADKTVVLLDEEESKLGERTPTAEELELRNITVYYPSRCDAVCVEIQYEDLACLDSGEYLTSTIMNFYIRFLKELSSAADCTPQSYHSFNTYFYKKLQEATSLQNSDKEASFRKLRRWWRGVNLFEKAYIFLPVHEDHHWSLAIVCIPDKEEGLGPIILHLDSLGYHSSRSIFQNVKRFVVEEWKHLKEEVDPQHVPFTDQIWETLPSQIKEKIITVPQQENASDCGLFVLHFMELFIQGAQQRFRNQDLGKFGRNWFNPQDASDLRWKIKTTLLKEFHKARNLSEPGSP